MMAIPNINKIRCSHCGFICKFIHTPSDTQCERIREHWERVKEDMEELRRYSNERSN